MDSEERRGVVEHSGLGLGAAMGVILAGWG
jgi:hypothetical protein